MARLGKTIAFTIMVATLISVVAYLATGRFAEETSAGAVARSAATKAELDWAATAPGRIEPVSGEIRISSSAGGRITRIYIRENDAVGAGALLAELENGEQTARVQAAEADVAFRQAERDRDVSNDANKERHSAEDAVAAGEQEVAARRTESDQLNAAPQSERSAAASVKAKASLDVAVQRLADARKAHQLASAMAGAAQPSRTVSALATARAELAIASANLEKTKLRAPQDGTVLQVMKRAGESVSTAADDTLFILADISHLRVRVELNERDVGHVIGGQRVVVRAEGYPDDRFDGRVSSIAPATRPKKLGDGLNASPSSERIVEVLVDLDQAKPLIQGLRVDAYFEQPKNQTVGDVEHASP